MADDTLSMRIREDVPTQSQCSLGLLKSDSCIGLRSMVIDARLVTAKKDPLLTCS